jgi:ankyrin repeat protein
LINTINRGNGLAVKALVEGGANLSLSDDSGYSPATAAAKHGDVEIMKMLLEAGVDAETVDENSRRPLDAAIRERNLPMILTLLRHDIEPSLTNINAINRVIMVKKYRERFPDEYRQIATIMRAYSR